MHILVSGGTGFIGSKLVPELVSGGHIVSVLSRSVSSSDREREGVQYLNDLAELDQPVEAVINLAGASLAGKRWNERYKREIVASRLETTRRIGAALHARGDSPSVWLNASAIGFYGPRGDEKLDETAEQGEGFAAELCADWESAAREAAGEKTRVCLMRLGVVLGKGGGAYVQMAQPFRMGVANWIGSGTQWLSWIHLDDTVAAMRFLLEHKSAEGAFNLTAPAPATSKGFCDEMREVHRTLLAIPMPAPVMRLMVGEMADELLISGQRVMPERLEELGFVFQYPDLAAALPAIKAA